MKTLRITLLIALVVTAAFGAAAQSLDQLSVRAGMEILAPSGGRQYFHNGAGAVVGIYYRQPLGLGIYFEPGVAGYYHTMSSQKPVFTDDHYYQGAAKVSGVRIPLMVGMDIPLLSNLDLNLATGPWLNINCNASQSLSPNLAAPVPVPYKSVNLFYHGFRHVDGIWGISLAMTFADHYRLGIDGGIAFTPLASFGNHDKKVKIYGNTVAVSLGYRF